MNDRLAQMEADAWREVRAALETAKGMHFDGCHKIYLSMDDEQVALTESYGYETHAPDFELIQDWYAESCGLRFIQSVRTNHDDPNAGYHNLIPQLPEWEQEEMEV